VVEAIVNDIDTDGIAAFRAWIDAPDIDRNLFVDEGTEEPSVSDLIHVEVSDDSE
jgi:ribosomal protein S12 methylthiotransferase